MNTTTQLSTYEQQAIDFLASTNTTFKSEFLRNDKYFEDDKEMRDIYKITLANSRTWSFEFGNSLASSGQYKLLDDSLVKRFGRKTISQSEYSKLPFFDKREVALNSEYKKPNAYDVLACLTKYDPGTFENFCNDYGYNVDSIKAEKIYKSVCEEWAALQRMFTDDQIELLREIN